MERACCTASNRLLHRGNFVKRRPNDQKAIGFSVERPKSDWSIPGVESGASCTQSRKNITPPVHLSATNIISSYYEKVPWPWNLLIVATDDIGSGQVDWWSDILPALGAGGPGFDSRNGPIAFWSLNRETNRLLIVWSPFDEISSMQKTIASCATSSFHGHGTFS